VGQEDNGCGNSMQLLFVKAAPSAVTVITFDSEKRRRRILSEPEAARKKHWPKVVHRHLPGAGSDLFIVRRAAVPSVFCPESETRH
jgi:hypothetical protein